MNNFDTTTIIGWETRNWRHNKKAVILCKDYGLKPILKSLYIGNLRSKERKIIFPLLGKIFMKKTEKIFTATLCQSCSFLLNSAIRGKIVKEPNFEIVQLSGENPKNGKKPIKYGSCT